MRTVLLGLTVVGILGGALVGARGTASAQVGEQGRFQMSTIPLGERGHVVVVVLDSVTGQVTPYAVHFRQTLDPGDLRISPIRAQQK